MAQARIGFDFNASCKDAEAPVKSLVNFLMKNGCLNFGMDFMTSSEASCEVQLDAERSEGNKYVLIVNGIYDTGEEGEMSETVIANGRLYSEDSEDEYVIKNQVFRLEKEEPEESDDPEEESEPTYRMTITADKEGYNQFNGLMLLQIPKVKNIYSWFSTSNTYGQTIGHSVMIPFTSQDALQEITHPLYAVSYNHPNIKGVAIVSKRLDYDNLKLVFSLDSGSLYIDVKDGDTLIASGETDDIILDGDICTIYENDLLYLSLSGDDVNYQLYEFINVCNTAITIEGFSETRIEFDFSDTDEIEVSLQGGVESAVSILKDDYTSKYKFNSTMEPVTSSLQSFHTIPNMYMNEEEADPYLRGYTFAVPTNDVNIPVNITVETSITDDEKDYLPYSVAIKSDSSYIDGWSTNYGKIKIAIADESKHPIDYQLRTSSFTVINEYNTYDSESDDYIFHVDTQDVYYKIGIFPLDGKTSSVADIKTQLMNCTLTNEVKVGLKEERNTVLALRNNYEENIVPTFDEIIRDTDICPIYPFYEDGEWSPYQIRIPNYALLPLYTTNKSQHTNTLTAFIYLQMCKNDDTPVDKAYYTQNEESGGYTAYIQINSEPTETSSETYEEGDELPPEPAEPDSLTAKISIIENDEEHTGFIASEVEGATAKRAIISFAFTFDGDTINLRYVCDDPDETLISDIEDENMPNTSIVLRNGANGPGIYVGNSSPHIFLNGNLSSTCNLYGMTFNLYWLDPSTNEYERITEDAPYSPFSEDSASATWLVETYSPSVSTTDLITGVFTVEDTDKYTYHGYTKFFWRVNSSDQNIRDAVLNSTFTFTKSGFTVTLSMLNNDGESEPFEIATFNNEIADFTTEGIDFELYAYHVYGGSTYPTVTEGTLYNRITDSLSLATSQPTTLSNISPLETDLSEFYVTNP